jgi:GNAT superfamily N-acetyltransferase
MGGAFEILPLTPAHWPRLVELFGPRGACAGCWCMFPRLTGAESKTQGKQNRDAFRRVVAAGDPPGLIAFDGGRPVGWVAVAPRAVYRRFERSRVLAPLDEKPVWSVPCFFVTRAARGRGITVKLLRAACAWAAARGARIIEGYPVDTRGQRYPATFAFHGTVETFERAGFREVARRSDTRPIMRRAVRRSAARRGRATGSRG